MNSNFFSLAQVLNPFNRNRKLRRRAKALARRNRSALDAPRHFQFIEPLEPRVLLSTSLPGIDPIDPSFGEANLLEIIDNIPLNDIQNALDHFPIPYVVWAQKDGQTAVVENGRAGAPTRIDVDDSKTTGKGGHDLIVEVNTILLPTPHLELSIERIGEPGKNDFVEDFSILIAFPFDAFTDELLPGQSNLFFGYETTGADGGAGGIAPLSEIITFTPGTLAGTDHLFDVTLDTTDDSNPLRFFAGHFDGDIDNGVLNFDGLSAWVQDVPDTINIGLDVAENDLFTPEMFTSFGLEWTATSTSNVVFNFVEDETTPGGGTTDYGTTVIVNEMPTSESLSISMDETNSTFTLSHRADSVIDELIFQKTRDDGLIIRGTATDIPTEVDLTYDFDPTVTLDVNDNTLDLKIEVIREGGIPNTDQFFGYNLGYASVSVVDAPDLTATWDPAFDSFSVMATNPGEHIGAVELILDDNAHLGAVIDGMIDMNADGIVDDNDDGIFANLNVINGRLDIDGDDDVDFADDGIAAGTIAVINGLLDIDGSGIINADDSLSTLLVGLATAPSYYEGLNGAPGDLHHIFSLVDDGTQGTAIGRLLQVVEATLDLDADASEAFHLETAAPALPLQAYLRTLPASTIVPGHDIETTCDVDNLPYGVFDIFFNGPGNFGYMTDPPQTIDSIHCFGHIDTLNFDIDAGGLPPVFEFEFDPDSFLTIVAEDGLGGPATAGHLAIRLWDEEAPGGLPGSGGLFGTPLRDARARVDDVPSFHATWSDNATGTAINFNTDDNDVFMGGAQIALSTEVELDDPLEVADSDSNHYARFVDQGDSIQLAAGAFGIDEFDFSSNDAAAQISLLYDADSDRVLDVEILSDFNSVYFPDYSVEADLIIVDVPQIMNLTVDLDPAIQYTASDGIDTIFLDAKIDETNDDTANGTELQFIALDLPSAVSFFLNPASGASLNMSDSLGSLNLTAMSETAGSGMFGTDYELLEVSIEDIPAQWTADWSGGNFLLEAKDAFSNPQAMGALTALLSTSKDEAVNAARLEPFTLDGPDGFRVLYSDFTKEIDDRYWPAGVRTRLQDLYGDSEQLDPGEDHVIVRKGGSGIEYASLQFTGFQKVSAQLNGLDSEFFFSAPTPGLHPLFAGYKDGDEFTTLQIENVPDTMEVIVNVPGQIISYNATDDVDPSAGQIDFYQGPLPIAGEGDDATRFIMNNTPASVELTWDFGFPNGAVNFDASDPFELLFLTQTGGDSRIVAGASLEDLQIGYNIDILSFDVAETLDIEIPVPCFDIPPICFETLFSVPVAWDLFRATVGIDNDADDPNIVGNPDKTPVDGFFGLYDFEQNPSALDTGTTGSGGEFIPTLTLMLDDFIEFSISAALLLDPLTPNLGAPLVFPFSIDIDIVFDASLVIDYWSPDNTEEIFTIPLVDFDIGILNPPDYTDNTPIHLFPFTGLGVFIDYDLVFGFSGLHGFDDHFDPYV